MGRDKKHKEKQLCLQFKENSGFGCEWELRKTNLLICFAGAQLFEAFRWDVIKAGISESCAGSCSAPFALTLGVLCVWNGFS